MKRVEELILKNLIYNDEFTKRTLPFIAQEYFSKPSEVLLFSEIQRFVNTYQTMPSHEALMIDIVNKKGVSAEDISCTVELLNQIYADKAEHSDQEWLIDQTESFCQERALYNAVMESVRILGGKDSKKTKGEIPSLLSDALAVTFDNHVGHDYNEDYDSRYDSYHKAEARIKTDLDYINKITKGGFPVKTLNVIMASTGVGKSLAMCHLAASSLALGYDVLYITMEMAEERIAERIDANLLNVDMEVLHKLSKAEYLKKFEIMSSSTIGKLIIKEYPTASASVLHFKALLNELKIKKNFKPAIIFIDYLNICCSSRIRPGGGVNSYTYVKSIAEELRGLAVEFVVPIISATQTNRDGYENSDVDLANTSESFGLPATVDWMVALMTNEELESLNQLMIKQLKNRYVDVNMYKRFVVGVDRSKMRLYDAEKVAQQGIIDKGKTEAVFNKFDSIRV